MEWPYASMRRHRLPPDERPIAVAEYNFLDRPVRQQSRVREVQEGRVVRGNTFTRNWVVDEKREPDHGHAVRAGCARACSAGKTNFWGRGALRYGPLQFKAASRDGFDVDWPISLRRREAVLRQGRRAARLLGHERRPRCRCRTACSSGRPSSIASRSQFKRAIAKMGRALHPRPRRRHHRRRPEQQVPHRSACGRGRCGRGCDICSGVPLADGAHLSRARHRQPHRSGRTRSSPRCSSTRRPAAPRGVRVIDANTREVMDFKARGRGARRRHARQHAHPAQLEVERASRTASATRRACSAAT